MAQGITSRGSRANGGWNITLFAFDAGEEMSEHTAPLITYPTLRELLSRGLAA
jgi:hypothetical protein